jgi:hypothetical protein
LLLHGQTGRQASDRLGDLTQRVERREGIAGNLDRVIDSGQLSTSCERLAATRSATSLTASR